MRVNSPLKLLPKDAVDDKVDTAVESHLNNGNKILLQLYRDITNENFVPFPTRKNYNNLHMS